MKHTIEFNLPEDQDLLDTVMKADQLKSFYDDIYELVRKIARYDFLAESDSVDSCLNSVETELRNIIRANDL